MRARGRIKFVFIGLLLNFAFSVPGAEAGWSFLNSLPFSDRGHRARLSAGIDVKETWDDNIYNRPSGARSDYILTVSPAVSLKLRGEENRLEAGYSCDANYYDRHPGEDFEAHFAKALLDVIFPSGLMFDIEDKFVETKDPRPEERRLRASHWNNYGRAAVGFIFPARKLSIETYYSLNYLEYHQSVNKPANRREDAYGATINYRLLPKTSLLLDYQYMLVDYYDRVSATSPDSENHEVTVGTRWDATAKLAGILKSGWKARQYINALDEAGNRYRDVNLWSAAGALEFKPLRSIRFDINLMRSIEESLYTGTASMSASSNYIKTGGDLGIKLISNVGLALALKGGYEIDGHNRLEAGKRRRRDETIVAGAGLILKRRWLAAGVNYQYSATDSNDGSRDELHNRVSTNLSVAF